MSTEAFQRQLEAIRAEFLRNLAARLDRIENLWSDLASGRAGPGRLAELERELHTLAGSANTLGVVGVSEAAAAAESFLAPFSARRKLSGAARQAEFARLLDALRRAAP